MSRMYNIKVAVQTLQQVFDNTSHRYASGHNCNWKGGPYTMRKLGAPPSHAYTHGVYDSRLVHIWTGTQAECEEFIEQVNIEYAKHIMTKGTAAEGL